MLAKTESLHDPLLVALFHSLAAMTRWSVPFLCLLFLYCSYYVEAHWMVSSVMRRFSPSPSSSSSNDDPVQELNDKINLLQSEIERLKYQLIRSKSDMIELRRSKIEMQQRHQEEIVAMRSQYATRVESMTVDYDKRIELVKIRLLEELKIQYETEKSLLIKELSNEHEEETKKLKNEINQLKSSLQSNEEDVKILKEELQTERKKVSESLRSHQLQEEAQAKVSHFFLTIECSGWYSLNDCDVHLLRLVNS